MSVNFADDVFLPHTQESSTRRKILRHGIDDFTSYYGFLSPLKIHLPRPDFNPRTSGPMITTRPPRKCLGFNTAYLTVFLNRYSLSVHSVICARPLLFSTTDYNRAFHLGYTLLRVNVLITWSYSINNYHFSATYKSNNTRAGISGSDGGKSKEGARGQQSVWACII
jgi:hypothetical protein